MELQTAVHCLAELDMELETAAHSATGVHLAETPFADTPPAAAAAAGTEAPGPVMPGREPPGPRGCPVPTMPAGCLVMRRRGPLVASVSFSPQLARLPPSATPILRVYEGFMKDL